MNLQSWTQLKQDLLRSNRCLENKAEHNIYAYKTAWHADIAAVSFDAFRAKYRCHIAEDYCKQVGLNFCQYGGQVAVTQGVRAALSVLWQLCEQNRWTVAVPCDVYPWYQAALATYAPHCTVVPFRQEVLPALAQEPDVILVCFPLKPWNQEWPILREWLQGHALRGTHIVVDAVYSTLPSIVANECAHLDW